MADSPDHKLSHEENTSDITLWPLDENENAESSFIQENVSPCRPVSYLASIMGGLMAIYSRMLNIFQWFFPMFAERHPSSTDLGVSRKLYWPSMESSSSKSIEFDLHDPDGRIAGDLPLGLYLVPDDKDTSYCIPPYNLAVHIKVNSERNVAHDFNELILSSLRDIATVMVKAFIRLHLNSSSIAPCTDLLINLPKKAKVSGKSLHFASKLLLNKTSGHSTFNHSFDGNTVAAMTFESLEKLLSSEELRLFQELKANVHFQEANIETPKTMAFLDTRCGLLYDNFSEESKRYSTYVASEAQEKAFLAFFSDDKPPLEMERVVSQPMWLAFRQEAITQLRRSLGKLVPCRAHSFYSSTASSIKGLCTSVKPMNIHNRSLSPLEKKGYAYNPVPDHMRKLWPELEESPGFDLQGVCFVATDRLVYEKLYDPNRENLLPLCWEKAIRKVHGGISGRGRAIIDKLAKSKLFCPCKSSALWNHVNVEHVADNFEILVQTYDGEA